MRRNRPAARAVPIIGRLSNVVRASAAGPGTLIADEPTTDIAGVMSQGAITYPPAFELPEQLELPRESRLNAAACRVLDVVVAGIALPLLAPLLIAIAIAIRLDSKGPVLFRQVRVGRRLKPLVVNKFRSMHMNAGHEEHMEFVKRHIAGEAELYQLADDELYKLTEDERVTRTGRFLRRSSLDELPQLINVLMGNMSLVGPRPALDYEVERYPPHALGRFAVKPGITGLWQVSGRGKLTFEEMIALDLEYAARRTFWRNVVILLRTVPVVLLRKGAA